MSAKILGANEDQNFIKKGRAPLGEHGVDEVGVGGSGHDLGGAVAHEVEHSQRQREPLQPLAAGAAHHLPHARTWVTHRICTSGEPQSGGAEGAFQLPLDQKYEPSVCRAAHWTGSHAMVKIAGHRCVLHVLAPLPLLICVDDNDMIKGMHGTQPEHVRKTC